MRFRMFSSICIAILSFISFSATYAATTTEYDVGRLSFIDGPVSLLPAGQTNWINAKINRPLLVSDRLWTDKAAKAELEFDSAFVFISEQTDLKILNNTRTDLQFQFTQGRLQLYVDANNNKTYELDTPNLAFSSNAPGAYRIDVNATSTRVEIMSGTATVYGENNSKELQEGQAFLFTGTNLQGEEVGLSTPDAFDNWVNSRLPKVEEQSYVSKKVIGESDLSRHGSWRDDERYGPIWTPSDVPPNWVPYRMGEWIWIEPWGWTWVDDAPWGFAPFHYGRWIFIDGFWAWVPGPPEYDPVWAPALVVFVDFGGPDINGWPYLGWFPLGPGEPYYPPYAVSENYFISVNVSNTIINENIVINYYNNPSMPLIYQNKLPLAITAVPAKEIQTAKPINKLVPVTEDLLTKAKVLTKPDVQPLPANLQPQPMNVRKPPQGLVTKPVLLKTETPATVNMPAVRVSPSVKEIQGSDVISPKPDVVKPQPQRLRPRVEPIVPTPPAADTEINVIKRSTPIEQPLDEPSQEVTTPQVAQPPVEVQKRRPVTINPAIREDTRVIRRPPQTIQPTPSTIERNQFQEDTFQPMPLPQPAPRIDRRMQRETMQPMPLPQPAPRIERRMQQETMQPMPLPQPAPRIDRRMQRETMQPMPEPAPRIDRRMQRETMQPMPEQAPSMQESRPLQPKQLQMKTNITTIEHKTEE